MARGDGWHIANTEVDYAKMVDMLEDAINVGFAVIPYGSYAFIQPAPQATAAGATPSKGGSAETGAIPSKGGSPVVDAIAADSSWIKRPPTPPIPGGQAPPLQSGTLVKSAVATIEKVSRHSQDITPAWCSGEMKLGPGAWPSPEAAREKPERPQVERVSFGTEKRTWEPLSHYGRQEPTAESGAMGNWRGSIERWARQSPMGSQGIATASDSNDDGGIGRRERYSISDPTVTRNLLGWSRA